jgi:hypothetical protein
MKFRWTRARSHGPSAPLESRADFRTLLFPHSPLHLTPTSQDEPPREKYFGEIFCSDAQQLIANQHFLVSSLSVQKGIQYTHCVVFASYRITSFRYDAIAWHLTVTNVKLPGPSVNIVRGSLEPRTKSNGAPMIQVK